MSDAKSKPVPKEIIEEFMAEFGDDENTINFAMEAKRFDYFAKLSKWGLNPEKVICYFEEGAEQKIKEYAEMIVRRQRLLEKLKPYS
jgi:hypothetical protein